MTSSLVGSEMCIRDSSFQGPELQVVWLGYRSLKAPETHRTEGEGHNEACLLYTSDAADDM
eukprot:6755981-Prorocentrum_lima.AAC.1